MKLGRSRKSLLLIIGIVFVVLALVSIVIGALGAAFTHRSPFTGTPHPELPPEVITHFGPVPVTNSMIGGWITTIILVVVFVLASRNMKLIPRGLQNFVEWAVEILLNFVEGVVGKERGRRMFPVIVTIFLFVVVNAWTGLIPGYGSITFVNPEGSAVPLLRPANTDVNVPLAIAIVSFIFVEYLGVSYHGVGYFKKFINLGPLGGGLKQLFTGRLKNGLSGIFMGGIQAFVGGIEFLSEIIRLVSFTFRLFGNMMAGEILLLVMFFLVPFSIPVIFYGMETFFGAIQALIFAGLTLVFAAMATAEHEH